MSAGAFDRMRADRDRARALELAARAQRMAADAHRRGDFLATARLMRSARQWREAARS
jgi:hypothetical protein